MSRPLVLKLGGELLETASAARECRRVRRRDAPASGRSSIVHGGGRAIDAELDRRGIAPKKSRRPARHRRDDARRRGRRRAGRVGEHRTGRGAGRRRRAGGRPDRRRCRPGRATRAGTHRSSRGDGVGPRLRGRPGRRRPVARRRCCSSHGYVPVIASLGLEEGRSTGRRRTGLLNVNADVMACRIAAALGDCDLVIAGATAGVLDARGARFRRSTADGIDAMIATGTATAGMVAKLDAVPGGALERRGQRAHRRRPLARRDARPRRRRRARRCVAASADGQVEHDR